MSDKNYKIRVLVLLGALSAPFILSYSTTSQYLDRTSQPVTVQDFDVAMKSLPTTTLGISQPWVSPQQSLNQIETTVGRAVPSFDRFMFKIWIGSNKLLFPIFFLGAFSEAIGLASDQLRMRNQNHATSGD